MKASIKNINAIGVIMLLFSIAYVPILIEDVGTYINVSSKNHGCCGFVSENWLSRPVTYALVDKWTEPTWKENTIGTEYWLTSEGLVEGEPKFWRLLERKPAVVVSYSTNGPSIQVEGSL
jgi:hypothetical protein